MICSKYSGRKYVTENSLTPQIAANFGLDLTLTLLWCGGAGPEVAVIRVGPLTSALTG